MKCLWKAVTDSDIIQTLLLYRKITTTTNSMQTPLHDPLFLESLKFSRELLTVSPSSFLATFSTNLSGIATSPLLVPEI